MFDTLKRIAGGNKSPTSAELRAARDEINEAALHLAVSAAEAALRDALIGGDEKAVERAEQQVATARRNLDRARAAIEILDERLVLAEQVEAAATLDGARAAAEAEAQAAADAIRKAWPGLQLKMVALLGKLDAAETAVADVNARLHAAGRSDEVVPDAEWRAPASALPARERCVDPVKRRAARYRGMGRARIWRSYQSRIVILVVAALRQRRAGSGPAPRRSIRQPARDGVRKLIAQVRAVEAHRLAPTNRIRIFLKYPTSRHN